MMTLTAPITSCAERLIIALFALLLVACGKDNEPRPAPSPATFTVTFNLNADDAQGAISPRTVEEGKTTAQPPDPTRDGYTFEGWFTDDNTFQNEFDFERNAINVNIILYAKWEPETVPDMFYTVKFETGDGAEVMDITVKKGEKAAMPDPSPTRDGYTFEGWFTDDNTFQNEFDFTGVIASDTTLYAKWEQRSAAFWIPDAGFRTKLKSLIPKAFDSNDSLLIEHESVTQRTALDVSSSRIADLTGIAYFTALKELNCGFNQLKMLDVSQNAYLTDIRCHSNLLTTLNVSQNTALTKLDCENNQLDELDIRGMRSASLLIIQATSSGANPLTSLNVHQNLQDHSITKQVKTRRSDEVTIATYRAEANATDYTLVCGDYDPNAGKCLFTVTFEANEGSETPSQTVHDGETVAQPQAPTRQGYTFLGWFVDNALQNAFHFHTPITEHITLYAWWERRPATFWVPDDAFRDKLKALMPEAFDAHDSLLIQHNSVVQRDALDVSSSAIADLTGIAYFTSLKELYGSENQLTRLDVSQNSALTRLACFNNQLTALNVGQNIALTELVCYGNLLMTLDVSQNAALRILECNNNQLAALDVSQNAALIQLLCYENQLNTLNASQNAALRILECNNNQLATLDMLQNSSLTRLVCESNQLTKLDVSQNSALTELLCSDNQLTELDMQGMRSVQALAIDASDNANPLEALRVHENLKNHPEVQAIKTARGDEVTIETYSAEAGSTDYTSVCADYNPNEGDAGVCIVKP